MKESKNINIGGVHQVGIRVQTWKKHCWRSKSLLFWILEGLCCTQAMNSIHFIKSWVCTIKQVGYTPLLCTTPSTVSLYTGYCMFTAYSVPLHAVGYSTEVSSGVYDQWTISIFVRSPYNWCGGLGNSHNGESLSFEEGKAVLHDHLSVCRCFIKEDQFQQGLSIKHYMLNHAQHAFCHYTKQCSQCN